MEYIINEKYRKVIRDQIYLPGINNLKYTILELRSELDYNDFYDEYWVVYDMTINNEWHIEFEYYPITVENKICLLKEVKVFKKDRPGQCFIYEYNNIKNLPFEDICVAVYLYVGKRVGYERYDARYENDRYEFVDCFNVRHADSLDVSFFQNINKHCERLTNQEEIGKIKTKRKKVCN